MNACILLATLKKEGVSNTEVLSGFLARRLEQRDIRTEVIKLAQHHISPGTYTDMGEGDEWPQIYQKLCAADIVIFATPVWWGTHSSLLQLAIERLDEVHDKILKGESSELYDKALGIVVTGGSDGAEHIIGNIANFANSVGMVFPPYATLTVLWEGHEKGADTSAVELLKKYEKDYAKTADTMADELLKYARGAPVSTSA